jgi:hypothetical protein
MFPIYSCEQDVRVIGDELCKCFNTYSLVSGYIYCSFHPECLDKLQDWVPHTQRRKQIVFQYMYADSFRVAPFTFFRPEYSRFLSVGNPKKLNIFSSNLKWRGTAPTYFSFPSNYSQPPWALWNSATIYDQKYSCLCCFGWMVFWNFFCELWLYINNHDSIKLERVL